MKLVIKHRKRSIIYKVKLTEEDLKATEWPKEELELLKRKNGSKKISDIIYGVQIQIRNIEKSKGFKAWVKRGSYYGRPLLRQRRKL